MAVVRRHRRMRRAVATGGVAAILLATLAGSASAVVVTQTVADGSAVAFTLRPAYDAGGADPLKLYVGYTAANVTTPEPEADGQSSWYNLGLLETGLFLPPEKCTPAKNAQATLDGVQDVQAWLTGYLQTAVATVQQGQAPVPPAAPGPRHPCTERFPGFAQSRYPATSTMPEREADSYLDKPTAAQACREDPSAPWCALYTQYWPPLRDATGTGVHDGSFFAESTNQPSQRSSSLLVGAGDGVVVSVGLSRTSSSAKLENGALVVESSSTLDDICLVAANGACTLRIDHLRQSARVVKRAGERGEPSAGTVLTGVHGPGLANDLDDAQLSGVGVDLGGYLRLSAVSDTGSCAHGKADPSVVVADAGGLLLSVKNGAGGQGGSVMIGGACARARIERTSVELPDALPDQGEPAGGVSRPGLTTGQPPLAGIGGALGVPRPAAPVVLGAPRTVSRTVTSYVYQRPLAWRTAPYWGVLLALVALTALACRLLPEHPAVAPVAGAWNLFARRFLRG